MPEPSTKQIAGWIRDYEDFFGQGRKLRTLPNQGSVNLHPLIAVGSTLNAAESSARAVEFDLREELRMSSVDDLKSHGERFFRYGHLSKAVGYHFLACLKEGRTIDEAADEASSAFYLGGAFKLEKIYRIPRLPEDALGQAFKGVTVFFDNDGTLLTGNLREGLEDIMERLNFRAPEGTRPYRGLLTTATDGETETIRKLHAGSTDNPLLATELVGILEAIDTIPVISPIHPDLDRPGGFKNLFQRSGKIYTELCQSLCISPWNSLIIGDNFVDRSAERTYPIPTMVISKETSPSDWVLAMDYFSRLGDKGGIAAAFQKLSSPGAYGHESMTWEPILYSVDTGESKHKYPLIRHGVPNPRGAAIPLYVFDGTPNVLYLGAPQTLALRKAHLQD